MNDTTNSDETVDCERDGGSKLETLRREDDWGKEAFRDAGEATFGNQ